MSPKRFWFVIGALGVAGGIIVARWGDRDGSPKGGGISPADSAAAPPEKRLGPTRPVPSPLSRVETNEFAALSATGLVHKALTTPVGRITPPQAYRLFAALAQSTNLAAEMRPFLSSTNDVHRLLGAFALFEGAGFTDELRRMALADPSPHVRAEIVARLLVAGRTDEARGLLGEAAGALSGDQAAALVGALVDQPRLGVPVAMHRLGLGQSLSPYVALLAMSSDLARARLEDSIADQGLPVEGRIRLLNAYALACPAGYTDRLWDLLREGQPLVIQSIAAARLAASMPGSDAAGRAALSERLGRSAPQVPPDALPSRERLASDMLSAEARLRELAEADPPDLPGIQQGLIRYLEMRRTAGATGAGEAVSAAVAAVRRRRPLLADPILAEAGAVVFRSRIARGGNPNR